MNTATDSNGIYVRVKSDQTKVAGTWQNKNGDTTYEFTPTGGFDPNVYEIVITTDVKDMYGNYIASQEVTEFNVPQTNFDLYIHDITMASYEGKTNYYYATATIWIKDVYDANVNAATVTGEWTDATTKGDEEGDTGADGKITLTSDDVKGGGTYVFTVTDVSATGYTYNPALNNETSDSIAAP
jgi:hypothetical protein